MTLSVVILAAGQGTRMRSALPKVLHPLAGRPLLGHVLDTARSLEPAQILVVHGHGAERVQSAFAEAPVTWVEQQPQLGTGHAVQQALPAVPDDHVVLVLYGDVPLISARTLKALLARLPDRGLALLTVELSDPRGYGRIIRDEQGRVRRIVEEKDADERVRRITEVNTGILAAEARHLRRWLSRVNDANAQSEYYLTDCVGLAAAEGADVAVEVCRDPMEVLGVNDRVQLARLERAYQQVRAEALMQAGVTVLDPARLDLRGELTAGYDVTLDVNVIIEGRVELGDGVCIGPNSYLRDCRIGPRTRILANCVIEEAEIGPDCSIGPYARLRPGSRLTAAARVGNFVEIKNARIGEGSKINHLSYVGDSEIGREVNIGAGTITCNYDGANKHRTVIGDRAFIGSNSALVAPVNIGPEATIGAGSVITRDAPAGELTLTRVEQTTRAGWKRPAKKG